MMNMNNMMKQIQKMQAEVVKLQEELAKKTVEATAGGGMVKALANGQQQIVEIKISPEAIDPDDVEMLEDLVLAAVNEAQRKAQEMVAKEMSRITGGLNLPPGLF